MNSEDFVPVTAPLASVRRLRGQIDAAIARVLDSGTYVLGPEVEALESEFASYLGVTHAVGVNSGTDAIALILRGLGIGRGDEVITVSHTAVATVAAIEQAGATPVLVDVDPVTLTMDPRRVLAAITPASRAVLPVHLYGNVCDLDALDAIASLHGLALIEDCSQAHGSTLRGSLVGSRGIASAFSSYPTKNLGALGDAGVIATSDNQLASRLRRLRQYGWEARNLSLEPGVNSRLDEIQAAILRVQLAALDDAVDARREIASRYNQALADSAVGLVGEREGSQSSSHLYVIRTPNREDLMGHLASRGIGSAVHYPTPVHLQPAYSGRVRVVASLVESELAAETVVSLPMFPEMTSEQITRVIDGVLSWCGSQDFQSERRST